MSQAMDGHGPLARVARADQQFPICALDCSAPRAADAGNRRRIAPVTRSFRSGNPTLQRMPEFFRGLPGEQRDADDVGVAETSIGC